jgi:hypothetical protein
MSTPNRVPNFHRIENIASSWRRCFLSDEEAMKSLHWEMDPAHYIPADETGYRGMKPEEYIRKNSEATRRIESKLNVLINHLQVPLPDEINPNIPSEKVKELVREGRMVNAAIAHRVDHGVGFAWAAKVIKAYKASLEQENPQPPTDAS